MEGYDSLTFYSRFTLCGFCISTYNKFFAIVEIKIPPDPYVTSKQQKYTNTQQHVASHRMFRFIMMGWLQKPFVFFLYFFFKMRI